MNFDIDIHIKESKIIPPDKLVLGEYFKKLSDGVWRIRANKRNRKATSNQFGYLFGKVLKDFQRALINAGFDAADINDVEAISMKLFASKDIINRNTGEIIAIPERKRKMTTVEMMTFVDSIRNYAAEHLNYFIDEPDFNWREK